MDFEQFAKETELQVRELKTHFSDQSHLFRKIRSNLQALISNELPASAFRPRRDKYAMNLVYAAEDKSFSIIAGVWQPGQTTPIHDHLTWALVGIYKGRERESIFRRTDNRENPKFAKLEMVSDLVNEAGHVTVLGETGIHRVDNLFDQPAWTIHVYGDDIGSQERHSYDPFSGEISTFTSGYCNVLRDSDQF